MRPVPLFGTGVKSYSQVVTSQRRLNCLFDIRQDQDKAGVVVVGTPGSFVWVSLPTYPVYGRWVVGTTLYVVAGTVLYQIYPGGSYTALGTMSTVAQQCGMSDCTSQLIIVDGVAGYTYTFGTSTLAKITDASFPNGTTSVAFLNSSFYATLPGTRTFIKSQPLDGTLWTPYVFGTKENASDLLLELDVINGTLVLFGQLTTEFWQDAGLSPLPVQRINGSTQNWGLAAIHSHVHAGNTIMFLGVNPDGGIRVILLNGYTATPISSSDVDSLIESFSVVEDATALVYSAYGHSVYQLTFPSENRTICYDLTTQMWHEAQTGLDPVGRHYANLGFTFAKKNYVTDFESGNIYQLDMDTYTDNGQAIRREVCTRHIRSDGNELFLEQLALEFETGVGNAAAPNPVVTIRISRDGGRTFGPEKTKPLGAVGAFIRRARFKRLGSSTDIVVMIAVTDAVKFVLASGSATIEVAND
jgi:hypothetical protein